DWDNDGRSTLLVASLAGVTQFNATPETKQYSWSQLVVGNPVAFPSCGAGEIEVGEYGKDKLPMLATIEPWHGHQAVVYTLNLDGSEWFYFHMWNRHVLDDQLVGGHAVGWGDFDGDGEDEMVAGSRGKADAGKDPCLKLFDLDFYIQRDPQLKWDSQTLDTGGIAVEDLEVADLDEDGDPDIVVIGRATHNLVLFENKSNK
ncbi:MAG: VCBS repeat-containing protein, partial [Candidatus Omnitrophica bacterium]|nr:VCBS repeat-containing protein [Candidatus Omnitrophota bacterium]